MTEVTRDFTTPREDIILLDEKKEDGADDETEGEGEKGRGKEEKAARAEKAKYLLHIVVIVAPMRRGRETEALRAFLAFFSLEPEDCGGGEVRREK